MVLLLYDKIGKKWNIITQEEKKKLPDEIRARVIYLDGKLKEKLDFAKKQISYNNDVIGAIIGEEGSGKSTFGGNVMIYMTDDNFIPNKNMIGSDYQDALNKIENIEDKGALMFDEGNAFFLSTETMTKEHRDLHKIFSIFRQKNLFVLIILPSLFRLGSYFAVDRAKFAVRTYDKDGKRGYFAYYGKKTKAKLYKLGKKEHDYTIVNPNFRGRFSQCLTLESKEYKTFKLKTLKEAFVRAKHDKKTPIQIAKDERNKIILNNPTISVNEMARIVRLDAETVRYIRKKFKFSDLNDTKPKENDTPSENPIN